MIIKYNPQPWTSLDDSFPPIDKNILASVTKADGTKIQVVGVWNDRFWVLSGFFEWDLGKVTHWMELPEDPQDEENEEDEK